MLSEKMLNVLNKQIKLEGDSSQLYLSMAIWSETKGMEGVAEFMYGHADEERQHMLKLLRFVSERGGKAVVPEIALPQSDFESLKKMFKILLDHEIFVSKSINEIVHVSLEEKDYASNNFLQWYVSEQIEEEALARMVLDKINLIGDDKGGLYLFDNDIKSIVAKSAPSQQ